MGKLIINSYEEFEQYVGLDLATSDYHKITQEQINLFADATLDRQWIHVDEERAKKESPYGATIAHGYLSVSMLAYLWFQSIEVNNITMFVSKYLKLYVARSFNIFFHVNIGIPESGLRFVLRHCKGTDQTDIVMADTHSASAAASRSLYHHRIFNLFC